MTFRLPLCQSRNDAAAWAATGLDILPRLPPHQLVPLLPGSSSVTSTVFTGRNPAFAWLRTARARSGSGALIASGASISPNTIR